MIRSIAIRYPSGGSHLWIKGSAAELLRAEFFGAPPAVDGGLLRYWNGATWAYATLRRWTGSAWQAVRLRYWNGAQWSATR
jgi:hypothetical protein